MPSITALTICTRSPASTYCGGTPVGTVDGCASDTHIKFIEQNKSKKKILCKVAYIKNII
jgi:hypothetical protein